MCFLYVDFIANYLPLTSDFPDENFSRKMIHFCGSFPTEASEEDLVPFPLLQTSQQLHSSGGNTHTHTHTASPTGVPASQQISPVLAAAPTAT